MSCFFTRSSWALLVQRPLQLARARLGLDQAPRRAQRRRARAVRACSAARTAAGESSRHLRGSASRFSKPAPIDALQFVGLALAVAALAAHDPAPAPARVELAAPPTAEPSELAYESAPDNPPAKSAWSFLQTGMTMGKSIPIQQKFDMKCMCSKEVTVPDSGKLPVDIPIGKCAATEIVVKQDETGTGMTLDEVKVHIGNPLKLQWAKVPKHHFSAVEGRTSHPILGTPGDLGEWLIALSIYEGMTNHENCSPT